MNKTLILALLAAPLALTAQDHLRPSQPIDHPTPGTVYLRPNECPKITTTDKLVVLFKPTARMDNGEPVPPDANVEWKSAQFGFGEPQASPDPWGIAPTQRFNAGTGTPRPVSDGYYELTLTLDGLATRAESKQYKLFAASMSATANRKYLLPGQTEFGSGANPEKDHLAEYCVELRNDYKPKPLLNGGNGEVKPAR